MRAAEMALQAVVSLFAADTKVWASANPERILGYPNAATALHCASIQRDLVPRTKCRIPMAHHHYHQIGVEAATGVSASMACWESDAAHFATAARLSGRTDMKGTMWNTSICNLKEGQACHRGSWRKIKGKLLAL
ncbi:hypothetical protein BC940DRAFT_290162 [Gongronella butleri]|nr:hypothetical protein BC940DRAFT_290162 [Gongronella butleri]